jgi:MYXO-CTERM domain-containing protein
MRHLVPIVLLLCLMAAARAEAKTVLSAKVCGANGCETSRDRALIAGLAEGGDPVDPPKAAAPFFRVRLTVGEANGKVMDRFWTQFMPKGELIRGSDGTWMPASEAYTDALKKIVNPSMEAYPASALAKLLDGDPPVPSSQAQVSSVVQGPQPPPAGEGGRSTWATIGMIVAGALAVAALALLAVRRRRRMVVRPRVT